MADVRPDLRIYKLMHRPDWDAFQVAGRFGGSAHDRADGFIHFSRAGQVGETANAHYADATDLVLVEVDTAPLIEVLRWEESRGGELFPHLYGTFGREEVTRHWNLERGVEGWIVPDGIA